MNIYKHQVATDNSVLKLFGEAWQRVDHARPHAGAASPWKTTVHHGRRGVFIRLLEARGNHFLRKKTSRDERLRDARAEQRPGRRREMSPSRALARAVCSADAIALTCSTRFDASLALRNGGSCPSMTRCNST